MSLAPGNVSWNPIETMKANSYPSVSGKANPPQMPAAPDPYAIANAQTQSNIATATAQSQLNNTNVTNPYGSSIYSSSIDPTTGLAKFTQNISLTPGQQQILNNQQLMQQGAGQVGGGLLGNLSSVFGQQAPLYGDLNNQSNQAVQQYYNTQKGLLDPYWNQQTELNANNLANQGIAQGSDAYNNAMTQFNNAKNQAYNQAQTNAVALGPQVAGQNLANFYGTQQAPLQNFSTLLGMSNPNMPVQQPNAQSSVQPTNLSQNVWNAYNAQMNNYNQQMQNMNNNTSGAMSGVGGILGGILSDRRAKQNIIHVGYLNNGLKVYQFQYKPEYNDNRTYLGVMADEVEKVIPNAVSMTNDGYKMVNYSMLGA
jgi:Chaperone of endosialidase